MTGPERRSALVVNPRALAGPTAKAWETIAPAARATLAAAGLVETRGDGSDVTRIGAVLAASRPDLVVAAGGDGTLSDVATALMRVPESARPVLGILPLGTANNVARSLGLPSVRVGGRAALDAALATLGDGRIRPLDLGLANGRSFVGSLAAGMDADILALRNRLRRRLRLGRGLGGYPLYLWSCAVNLVARGHGARARIVLDDGATTLACRPYNLLVTNTALYAGEFRFDDEDRSGDGLLELHLFGGAVDYTVGFVRAWRRQVAHERGRPSPPPPDLRRVHTLTIDFALPVAIQIDGEEAPPAARLEVRVLAAALRVLVP